MPSQHPPVFSEANADYVADRLAVGGDVDLFHAERARRQVAELLDRGVSHVVDCRIEWDDTELWAGTGVQYLHVPIDDAGQQVPPEWFEDTVGRVLRMLEDPDALVLTHCHMGVNRGPSLGYAVLLGLGWDPVDALAAIRKARPVAFAFYAEDALEWWLGRQGVSGPAADEQRWRLAEFRRRHRVDVRHVIADIRTAERDAGPTIRDG
jgi:hypothetical protein